MLPQAFKQTARIQNTNKKQTNKRANKQNKQTNKHKQTKKHAKQTNIEQEGAATCHAKLLEEKCLMQQLVEAPCFDAGLELKRSVATLQA